MGAKERECIIVGVASTKTMSNEYEKEEEEEEEEEKTTKQ